MLSIAYDVRVIYSYTLRIKCGYYQILNANVCNKLLLLNG